ncbi:fatty acid desaturase [Aestuariirhabdus sp. Z084]|uniref:fatty acid desaturase n=1 Tax=Aestuariirhabdus haliotis TaxID=2918751 RepID=UPI00201B4556|nr:fatty acid desaturase [Aestuariirhabdus haliotis]MCL6415715.1 fatty acid desaturase [Aestuariirhabdus haliotis]MCL6419759.1 fatty acid desaturase [Aestuariirhabdus haliotis]
MTGAASNIVPPLSSNYWKGSTLTIAWGTVALFAVIVAGYGFLFISTIQGSAAIWWALPLSTLLCYLSFTVMHEAGHGNIIQSRATMKPLENAMGWLSALPFFILPYRLFAAIHDQHHAFTNDPERDPDYWVGSGSFWQASYRSFSQIWHYLYRIATGLYRNPAFAGSFYSSILHYLLVGTFIYLMLTAGYGWELLMLGVVPLLISLYVLAMLFDWIPHTPSKHQGRYRNTRIYRAPGLKYLTLGQNYHLIHHMYPRVPWYHYERVFHEVRPELEANNAAIENLVPHFLKAPSSYGPLDCNETLKLNLCVTHIRHETPDAVVIEFETLNQQPLRFQAGQYITVSKQFGQEQVTRCYSICESPSSGKLSIGVKRVANGLMSNYLNRELKAGDCLTVAGPFGEFTLEAGAVVPRTKPLEQYCFIAAGSGITPILSLMKTALERDSCTHVQLIYFNRSQASALFMNELIALEKRWSPRLTIIHGFDDDNPSSSTDCHSAAKQNFLLQSLKTLAFDQVQTLFYLCGPEALKAMVMKTLSDLSVTEQQILVENFSLDIPQPEGVLHQVKIQLANGQQHQLDVASNQTVLEVARQQRLSIPHACGVGQCGCCMMKITNGQATLANPNAVAILPAEQQQGFTLACQCRPQSDLILCEQSGHI